MNFCPHCGAPMNGASTCPKCGADPSASIPKKEIETNPAPIPEQSGAANSGKLSFLKKNIPQEHRKYAVGAAILVMILTVLLLIILPGKKKVILLTDYVSIDSISGANGYGHVEYSFDSYGVYAKLSGADKLNDANAEDFFSGDNLAEIENIWTALECVSVTADKNDNLSNGDKVTLFVRYNDPGNVKLDYELRGGDISFTVEELTDGLPFTPLADDVISVAFTGASGNGEAILGLVSDNDIYNAVTYRFSQSTGLSNGDEVTLTATFDREALESMGYAVPYSCEKTYIVSGLKDFFKPSDGLSASERTRFEELTMSSVSEEAARSLFTKNLTMLDSEFWGLYYFETKTPGTYFYDMIHGFGGHCGIIGMASASFDERGKVFENHYLVMFPDCMEGDDGHLVYSEEDFIVIDGTFSDESAALAWMADQFPEITVSKLS